jgi:hypothetical protein
MHLSSQVGSWPEPNRSPQRATTVGVHERLEAAGASPTQIEDDRGVAGQIRGVDAVRLETAAPACHGGIERVAPPHEERAVAAEVGHGPPHAVASVELAEKNAASADARLLGVDHGHSTPHDAPDRLPFA